ncbi:MAG: hypothetical protein J7L22_10585 [Candidatus Marinimicrobia bacterium]|nr:hypothetical protein [Candidatus Neomarinimicrobiota bacterium]RKY62499.1 MAG: hypothetical protein DRP96_00120 [Candidatus Neomarinimicrobiota bacterium]
MKYILTVILALMVITPIKAQETVRSKDIDYTAYGQMIYWKALNQDEKKVFLQAYLYRTHEVGQEMQANRKLRSAVERYEDDIAAPVYNIFRQLEDNDKIELIKWIDVFYRQEFNHEESFGKALRYAYEKLQRGSESMHDVYRRAYSQ